MYFYDTQMYFYDTHMYFYDSLTHIIFFRFGINETEADSKKKVTV